MVEKEEMVGESSRSDFVFTEPESFMEQTHVINGNEGTTIANPKVEVQTSGMDEIASCSEDIQNVKCESVREHTEKDCAGPTDLGSPYEQGHVAERGEVERVSIEAVLDCKYEVSGNDNLGENLSSLGKDQNLMIEKVDGGSEKDMEHEKLESSRELVGDITIMDNGEGPTFSDNGRSLIKGFHFTEAWLTFVSSFVRFSNKVFVYISSNINVVKR